MLHVQLSVSRTADTLSLGADRCRISGIKGTLIGRNDSLIAARDLAYGVILVTGSEYEFRRVPYRRAEDRINDATALPCGAIPRLDPADGLRMLPFATFRGPRSAIPRP